MTNEILVMKNITKVYGNGVLANENVNFSLNKGEIHAIVGENGAGKSTLMKILFAIELPDKGEVYLNGNRVKFTSPSDAIKNGIGMVHQHFNLLNSLTVAENVVLGCEPKKGILIDRKKCVEQVQTISDKYQFNLDVNSVVADLSVGKKQKIEILKTLYRGAKLLVLDEPTAVLTPQETKELFEQLINMKKDGFTIVFITHHLNEVLEICDRLTIMRQGKTIGTYPVEGMTESTISKRMVGRDVVLTVDKEKALPKEEVLLAEDLKYVDKSGKTIVDDVSFRLRAGEIVGIAGLEGSGQSELVAMITGMQQIGGGKITLEGSDMANLSILKIREKGLSFIPEDRIQFGTAVTASIKENLISNRYHKPEISGKFFISDKKENALAKELIDQYQIVCKSADVPVGMLSGGNMQKVVVARELSVNPKVIIAEQPTRGVDVGAIEFIHKKLVEMRDAGAGILLITADLNEVLELSDSVLIMREGQIAAYFENSEGLTEEELGFYMLGIKAQSKQEVRRILNNQ